jgi:MFS superfamily sulfate permease-like transporter
MSDATGGRTQVTGLVAAGTIAAVLLFFTGSLRYLPVAALGVALVKAALSLVDFRTLNTIYKLDRREFALSVFATLGVVAVGAVHAILIAVQLNVIPEATTITGLLLLRFNSPIVFFNAPYFKREVIAGRKRGWSISEVDCFRHATNYDDRYDQALHRRRSRAHLERA